ncbi:hypothetical protein BD626DRAFT_571515 [Schizophyllum amplum]|uniref:glycerol kinase n=1 Tax=Schizophyllum amplum TaxID=97359 RepID=A0A550C7P7_9AGAR|nr:hypothetical protein BD626DRAFT_571515 [Auriculariopsis ampla]
MLSKPMDAQDGLLKSLLKRPDTSNEPRSVGDWLSRTLSRILLLPQQFFQRLSLPSITPRLRSGEFVGSLDCGTTSVRFIVFNQYGEIVAHHQLDFPQYYPSPGWHDHDAEEIFKAAETCIEEATFALERAGWARDSIKAIGITNQRETTVAWSRTTGKPLCRAIVWTDSRTRTTVAHHERQLENVGIETSPGEFKKGEDGKAYIKKITGLPLSTYFSAIKLRWMIDHYPRVRVAHDSDDLLFGTIECWIIYKLTAPRLHITDVSNAARTLLLDIKTLQWSPELLSFFRIRASVLPKLVSSSEVYGAVARGPLAGVPIAGLIGDQQGRSLAIYAGPHAKPVYALEGSIAVAGSAIKWLRDSMGLIDTSADVNTLAARVPDTGGLYFVTAFSGLLAPYWDASAGGLLIGLSQSTTPAHIARAALEAIAFQTRAIVGAMKTGSGMTLTSAGLRVDGGVTSGDVAMQVLADIGGFAVERPEMRESTALGAALLAGSAVKLWGWDLARPETLKEVNTAGSRVFVPNMQKGVREKKWEGWKKAVERSSGWEDVSDTE